MNNTVNVFRVDRSSMFYKETIVGVGPYVYFTYFAQDKRKIWGEHCDKYEPKTYKKFGIDNYKLTTVPTLLNETRPGPFEDFQLREKILRFLGKMDKGVKEHFYCFDSIAQFKKWFVDCSELEFLTQEKFVLSHYKVTAKNFHSGSSQGFFVADEKTTLKARLDLNTLLRIE